MKYKLTTPVITPLELNKINVIADYLGYNFIFHKENGVVRRAIIETMDKEVAYIQKDGSDKLFLIWKSTENIQYIDPLFDVCANLNKYNVVPNIFNKIAMALGINAITKTNITADNLQYLCRKS